MNEIPIVKEPKNTFIFVGDELHGKSSWKFYMKVTYGR